MTEELRKGTARLKALRNALCSVDLDKLLPKNVFSSGWEDFFLLKSMQCSATISRR